MTYTPTELVILDYLADGPASFYSLLQHTRLRPDRLNRVLAGLRERRLVEWVDGQNETLVKVTE